MLIEQMKYFVLHAPRQTGKTSCFREVILTKIREIETKSKRE